jgi:hypothetical protein
MGTKVAPSLANAFMDSYEDNFVYSYHTQPHLWKRYIDDVFCIWTAGQETFDDFVTHLNQSHTSIKFTSEQSNKEVSFLDTKVILHNNRLTTDLYTKPTDTHSYLRYDSAHHPSCKKTLPYSQFLRLRRICNNDQLFEQHANEMHTHFVNQGYPEYLLGVAKAKAR